MAEGDPFVRVVIVDDAEGFRTLLAGYLEGEGRFDVVGMAADGAAAEHVIDLTDPDVVILDVHMPRENGLDVLARLRHEHSRTMFVMSTVDDTVATAAARLGADLCVDKLTPFDELCDAILASLPPSD